MPHQPNVFVDSALIRSLNRYNAERHKAGYGTFSWQAPPRWSKAPAGIQGTTQRAKFPYNHEQAPLHQPNVFVDSALIRSLNRYNAERHKAGYGTFSWQAPPRWSKAPAGIQGTTQRAKFPSTAP
jgi:hypothetical protein